MTATTKGILFWQLNLQHSRDATANLARQMAKSNDYVIAAVQGPYYNCRNGRIPGFSGDFVLHYSEGKPRAALIARGLHVWGDFNQTNRDTACGVVTTKDGVLRIASSYQDITHPGLCPQLMSFVDKYQRGVIVLMDSNAHSTCWGCPSTNERGEMVEEFIMARNLSVINVGRTPTFKTSWAESIIDITVVSGDMLSKTVNWMVNEEFQFSDHRRVEFRVEAALQKRMSKWPLKKADWRIFKEALGEIEWLPPPRWNSNELDKQAGKFMKMIGSSLDRACGPRPRFEGPRAGQCTGGTRNLKTSKREPGWQRKPVDMTGAKT